VRLRCDDANGVDSVRIRLRRRGMLFDEFGDEVFCIWGGEHIEDILSGCWSSVEEEAAASRRLQAIEARTMGSLVGLYRENACRFSEPKDFCQVMSILRRTV